MSFKRASEEFPLFKPSKQIKSDLEPCILCYEPCEEKQKTPSDEEWETFRLTAEKWLGLDRFSDVFHRVDWKSGHMGKLWHKSCKLNFAGERRLQQAMKRKRNLSAVPSDEVDESHLEIDERPPTRSNTGIIHSSDLCLWCMKGEDKRHPDRNLSLFKVEKRSTWLQIIASMAFLRDQKLKNRLRIFADATPNWYEAKIMYHKKCYKHYLRPLHDPQEDDLHDTHVNISDINQLFINQVSNVIFQEREPRTLVTLLKDYEYLLLEYGLVRTSLKTTDIKQMLEESFGDAIGFQDRFQKNESTLVYNKEDGGSYLEAAINGWGVSDLTLCNIFVKRIRDKVLNFNREKNWPYTVDDLLEEYVPEPFLHRVVEGLGGNTKKKSQSENLFLCDILESHITSKATPLKTQYSVNLHGSTRSRELSDTSCNLGVSISYKNVLYLYDMWALNELEVNPKCPDELGERYPGTAVIDNDDWKIDDVTGGSQSVNRTNMMFLQPEKWISKSCEKLSSILHVPRTSIKSKLKDIALDEHKIKSYSTASRGKPGIYEETDLTPPSTTSIKVKLFTHALVRTEHDESNDDDNNSPENQKIGAFTGFMNSVTPLGDKSKAYYFLSLPQPPSKPVIFTLLEKAVTAAIEKKMPFIQCVGDQPVYSHIVELKNENPEKFALVLPILGSFHIQMSFMSAIYKRIKGSNIEDLLSEAGLITMGAVHKALKGHDYLRALRLYKLFYESLARLLINHGKQNGIELHAVLLDLLETVKDTDVDREERHIAFQTITQSDEFQAYVQMLRKNVESPESHMAKFILSIMDMIEILFLNIDSIRTNNWTQFKNSLRLMMPWMIIYDNCNYGRWLPIFWLDMVTLPKEHETFMADIFAQSLTGNAYSAMPPDLWIECTMNKSSKLKAGWKYLLKNERSLLVHIKNVNNVNLVKNTLSNLISQLRNKDYHHENSKPRRKLDEKAVQDILSLIKEWECDPFEPSAQQLRTLMSGQLADEKLTLDFESALSDGENLIKKNISQRHFSNEKSIYDTLPRQNRSSFASYNEKGIKDNSCNNAESKVATKLIDLYIEDESKSNIFDHRITDECLAIFNENGTLRKSQKSKLLDVLNFSEIRPLQYIAILDMGYIWRLGMPQKRDEYYINDGTRMTWGDFAKNLFQIIVSRHPEARYFFLVNDYYGTDVVNIKDGERKSRSKFIGGDFPNVYLNKEKELPSVRLFKDFFKNVGNKQRLQAFLQKEFNDLCCRGNKKMIYCLRDKCIDISTNPTEDCPFFQSQKVEADSYIFYIYAKIREVDEISPVVCDAEDTDVLMAAAFVSNELPGVLGIKRKKTIFDCKTLCSEDMAKVAIRAHVMTGCDYISSFFGRGKKGVWKQIEKSKEARDLLLKLNEESLRKFTIKYIYNDNTSKSLGEMRKKKWKNMKKKKNFAGIGIDEDSHVNRSKRVQFVVNCVESYDKDLDDENPLLNGYQLNSELRCVPLKYTKDPLPQDILSCLSSSNVDDSVNEVTENEKCDEDNDSDDDHDDFDDYGDDDVDEVFDF